MEQMIDILKVSAITTPLLLALVAVVQVGNLKRDHERTKSVLKATMAELDRIRREAGVSELG